MIIRKITSKDYIEVEELIKKAILVTVSKDYEPEALELMLESDPYQPKKTKNEREYYVAFDLCVIGVIGRKNNMVKTFFVDPSKQAKGVGTELLNFIENIIQTDGYDTSILNSTITAKSFYEKLGYSVINEKRIKRGNSILTTYSMIKHFT